MKTITQLFSVLSFLYLFTTSCTSDSPVISNLKCEYLADPCGIDIQNPRLSWEILSKQKGQKQTACHILVASSEKMLEANVGDLWDAGKIESDRSVHMVYQGRELESREKVFWKVRIWDCHGFPSPWSKTASWEMGLYPSDWKAQWIGLDRYKEVKPEGMNPAMPVISIFICFP